MIYVNWFPIIKLVMLDREKKAVVDIAKDNNDYLKRRDIYKA